MGAVTENGEEEGIAGRLWTKSKRELTFALYTPFVVGVASGMLDSQSFLHCICQDVFFLQAFAQAYELAEEYADDEEDKASINKLRKRVLRRLVNQDALVRDWGFELPEESTPDIATIKYVEFLKATASGKVGGEKYHGKIVTPFERSKLAAYALSAIAPCMRLYSMASKEIKVLLDPNGDNLYKKWIDSLSSQKFEASASRIEDLLDKLSISLTGAELEVVEQLYHEAVKLELDFISSQPINQPSIIPVSRVHNNITIFCDFDMTCTAIDSSALLAEIAIASATRAELIGCETEPSLVSSSDLRITWSNLSSQYIAEYEQSMENIVCSEAVGSFDYDALCKALEKLSDLEKKTNARVVNSNALKGLNFEDINRAGELLTFQDGCKEFFQEIVRNENMSADVHVLSYCWCGDLIRSAFSAGPLDALGIHSNDLVYEESISTGEMIGKMESPMDKLEAFNNTLKCSTSDSTPLTVYIGGSVGDLLCLLKADVGIVIGLSASLRRLGDKFGISFVPLFSGLVKKQREVGKLGSCRWNGLSGVLYTVSSWAEIHAFILGA